MMLILLMEIMILIGDDVTVKVRRQARPYRLWGGGGRRDSKKEGKGLVGMQLALVFGKS